MSRPKRVLRKKFIVFCEGDTEYNYVDGMRLKQGVELALKPINMQGGGYKSFLDEIKKEASNNCLAKFIIIDFDRTKRHSGELEKLKEIIKYFELQNGSLRILISMSFLISSIGNCNNKQKITGSENPLPAFLLQNFAICRSVLFTANHFIKFLSEC